MATPSVKGYMPLCVTPRSKVCDEQGVGQWPMWKRYDSVKSIIDQYIDEPYRDFLALPYHEIDKLKAEELFYWYTPRCETSYVRMSRTGDDRNYYKELLDKTVAHYQTVVAKLQREKKAEEANFLALSLKYVGESEDNVYCGDNRVVAAVWGMRPRQSHVMGESKLFTELLPEVEMHTVRFELGSLGSTDKSTTLKKSHGTKIFSNQVPSVKTKGGFEFAGWDNNPLGAVVTGDLVFTALYREQSKKEERGNDNVRKEEKPEENKPIEETTTDNSNNTDNETKKCHIRFLTPDNHIIKELDVEHGKQILPGLVPQLPSVNGLVCPSWDGNPLNDIIDADRDYKAISPKIPEKPQHIVRFLLPNGQELSRFQVEHGGRLLPTQVPPLPVVNGKVCPSWDTNPIGELINVDRDFTAKPPQTIVEVEDKTEWHTVRFLNPDGSEIMRTQVQHGERIKAEQIPSLPIINGKECSAWLPNPSKQAVFKDSDFVAQVRRSDTGSWLWGRGNGRGFWRWVLRIALLILLVFLVLYIVYLCNPCSK